MRISDWSSDVCSSDLSLELETPFTLPGRFPAKAKRRYSSPRHPASQFPCLSSGGRGNSRDGPLLWERLWTNQRQRRSGTACSGIGSLAFCPIRCRRWRSIRSEEHTSELQSLMRISYAVFCLKKKKKKYINTY